MEKRLYRSRKDTFISGVCGGIAEYFNFDISLVRIAWVVVTIATNGLGLIAYIITAIVVPLEPVEEGNGMDQNEEKKAKETVIIEDKKNENDADRSNDYPSQSTGFKRYTGLFLIILGAFIMVKNYIPSIDFSILVAIFLIIIGFSMMMRRR